MQIGTIVSRDQPARGCEPNIEVSDALASCGSRSGDPVAAAFGSQGLPTLEERGRATGPVFLFRGVLERDYDPQRADISEPFTLGKKAMNTFGAMVLFFGAVFLVIWLAARSA
jgi:hypothetical protein